VIFEKKIENQPQVEKKAEIQVEVEKKIETQKQEAPAQIQEQKSLEAP
jgi:hypothetical protein